ncbi:MAG: metal-dependent hydrolase [Flavobacteriales bacterium]|nr:metal-dependent hydrolase [Flavobacteriales bacterium]
MDSLTQIVLGASVAEVALGKKVGNKAILWGAIAGTIPDLDVLAKQFTDIVTANEIHRGFSHSILFCVIAAPILGWIANKIHAKEAASWREWSNLMFWCLVTHPLLDAHTTWGTQLFWPFELRVSYQNIFVADPLYTVPFLACVAIAMFYKRNNPKRANINKLGIIISTSYMAITLLLKGYTYFKFEDSLKHQQIDYNEISNRPTPLNSVLWTANVDTDSSYFIGYYSIFDKSDQIEFQSFEKNRGAFRNILDEDIVKRLIKMCKGWYLIQKTEEGYTFSDMRFGMMGFGEQTKNFVFQYQLSYDEHGELIATHTQPKVENAGELFSLLWKRVKGV